MSTILAIDPGCTESAYALIDADACRPLDIGKVPNAELRAMLRIDYFAQEGPVTGAAIEMIRSYGMTVGAEVFDTCVWIGRFIEASGCSLVPIYRAPVKLHHCHSSKATDANVSQALKDRFAYGVRNHGKGTKADPGWFYGFAKDIWQAYALAVYAADIAHQETR